MLRKFSTDISIDVTFKFSITKDNRNNFLYRENTTDEVIFAALHSILSSCK